MKLALDIFVSISTEVLIVSLARRFLRRWIVAPSSNPSSSSSFSSGFGTGGVTYDKASKKGDNDARIIHTDTEASPLDETWELPL